MEAEAQRMIRNYPAERKQMVNYLGMVYLKGPEAVGIIQFENV